MSPQVDDPVDASQYIARADIEAVPHDNANDELVDAIATQFIARPDVKAVQHGNGIYTPDKTPFTRKDLQGHLQGTRTLGHYMVGLEDDCKLFAFDIDLAKPFDPDGTVPIHPGWPTDADGKPDLRFDPRGAWKQEDHPMIPDLCIQLRCVAEALALRAKASFGVPVTVAYSGNKGLHVYVFAGRTPAAEVQEAAWFVMESFGEFERFKGNHFWRSAVSYPSIEIETFPKQISLEGKEFGNLMRLPLGIHRGSGARGFIVDCERGYNQIEPHPDPVAALREGNI